MKTSKAVEAVQVTPPQKKLKQARLPFKLISDVSPKPEAPSSRKRKLSVPEEQPVTKLGKISKENDVAKELVVISDEESRDGTKPQTVDKSMNPFVKLVDTAWKKKLQKSKTPKRKNKSKSTKKTSASKNDSVVDPIADKEWEDVDMVEADVQIHIDGNESDEPKSKQTIRETIEKTDNNLNVIKKDSEYPTPENENKTATTEELVSEKSSTKPENDVICLDDSNNSVDKKTSQTESSKRVEKLKKDTPESPEKESNNTIMIENNVTPKSSRIKTIEKINFNTSTTSSKLNESITSEPSTPKQSSKGSPVSKDESLNDSTLTKNLTPKQLQKKVESAKKRQEKEMEKQEREKKRLQEKEERAKQRQEKEDQKKREREEKEEAKRKEREEKEEQKKKEREEKEKQRETEKKLREMKEEIKKKEKEDKEEQRKKEKEAREEERRKKQEAMEQEKLEQEMKKKKAAEAFANFFVPKQKVEKDQIVGPSKTEVLSSFTVKSDMRLAPLVRVDLTEEKRDVLDRVLEEQNVPESCMYLKSLKEGAKTGACGKTWPLTDKDDDDVMIIEDELPPSALGLVSASPAIPRERLKAKLLAFHENRRPPYWGTWRRKSGAISARRPFGQEKLLDYEADSDDDWEEEAEGESLDGSVGGSDDEPDAEYEVDNALFVPHGYLSDEEATMDDEDKEDMLSLSPETQKARLKHLEDEFETEMKKPTEKLKPRLYGLVWETEDGGKPDNCADPVWNYFQKFAMVLNDITPLLQPSVDTESVEKKKVSKKKAQKEKEGEEQSPRPEKKKKTKEVKEKTKTEPKKIKPNQPGINSFLTKLNST